MIKIQRRDDFSFGPKYEDRDLCHLRPSTPKLRSRGVIRWEVLFLFIALILWSVENGLLYLVGAIYWAATRCEEFVGYRRVTVPKR